MTSIRITPSLLNQIASRHDGVADEIAVARSAGSEILAAVATHGPIMHQFKAAANDVVQRRDSAFAEHEAAHRTAADKLRSIAAQFSEQDEINAAAVRLA
jgi:Excreted virulence factor EspC, type VII ESX diderm